MSQRNDYDGWDDFENESGEDTPKPFFEVADKDDEDLSKWMDEEISRRVKNSRGRLREYEENTLYWKGLQNKSQFSDRYMDDGNNNQGTFSKKSPKIVDNLSWETMEEKIAQMIRYRPSITVLPANNEWDDDMSATSVKQMIDTRWYDVGIEKFFIKDQFYTFLYGTSVIRPYWDEDEGPLNEVVEKAKKFGDKIDTSEIENDRIGDVNYKLLTPDMFFPEEAEEWDKVNNCFELEYRCPYELAKEYEDANINPEEKSNNNEDDLELNDKKKNRGKILVRTFYHRPTKFLKKGVKITSIHNKILKREEFEHPTTDSRPKLPYILHVDIEEPKSFWGRSYLRLIKQAQDQYNGLNSTTARSFAMASVPKWFVPWGSCDLKTISNGHTIIKYKGAREPKMVAFNPISAQVFEQMDRLKASIDRKSKVYNIYRRDQKIDLSGLALQFLDEQESESVSVAIQRRAQVFIDTATMTMELMKKHYKKEDGRMKKIFGDDDTYIVDNFDSSVLASKYSVRLQNSPALPQHKSSKIQMMLDVHKEYPDLIERETFLDLLELAKNKPYMDIVTVSAKSANYENDIMLKQKGIPEPKSWENHIVHYELHVKKLQERKYKTSSPEGVIFAFKKHILATEMLMWDKGRTNPAFRQKLLTIDYFPVFFRIPDEEISIINSMAMGSSLSEGESKEIQKELQDTGYKPVAAEDQMPPTVNPITQ